jgi:hypothetical protein
MTPLTKASSEPTLRSSSSSSSSRGSCLKSKQKDVTSSRRGRGVKFLVAKEILKRNVPDITNTTREDALQSMNTRRRFKRRGSKSSSMMIMDLIDLALSEVSVECTEGSTSTHTTESIQHQQEDRCRNGLVVCEKSTRGFPAPSSPHMIPPIVVGLPITLFIPEQQ